MILNKNQQLVEGNGISGAPYPRWRSRIIALLGLLVILLIVVIFATSIGSVDIPFSTTFVVLTSKLPFIDIPVEPIGSIRAADIEKIVIDIRLPRVLLAGLVGAALALAGATYQGLFRNPLADPYLIGVAQGAALGAVIGFLIPVSSAGIGIGLVPILAFVGALLSVTVVYLLARVGRTVPTTTLILAGVALGALLGAIVSYLAITSGQMLQGIMFWLTGSFSLSQWNEVWIVLPIVAIGAIILLLFSRPLNIMQLDEEQAQQLGISVEKLKLALLVVATMITAAAVSFVGIIGFVGIITPHAVRLIWGPDYRFLLPLSLLSGAVFLILADVLARTAAAPSEIPIGVITALCGAPFFLYLLKRRARTLY
ncbi:MAG TPA: iron chelate uptake ABC transporter family permease subunit [Dehalococcoidia bacterium]|nr:iron chelate uptake ABC transporter family permease subunit [Dehalococcoidia bacterium]